MKQKLSIIAVAFFLPTLCFASSETITAQKGVFRLLSADINEEAAYHFRTSVQFFQQGGLLKDVSDSTVRATQATLGVGYALLPNLHLSAHGGFKLTTREPEIAVGGVSPGAESVDMVKGGFAVTGTYDVGKFFQLPENRFTTGLSLWVNLGKVTRFFDGPDVIPTAIFSGDFTDSELFPWRTHLNLGFRLANAKRYFEENDTTVTDLDFLGTDAIDSNAITAAWGIEFPFPDVTPSLEVHMHKLMDSDFRKSPSWVTLGLKGKPFPQKNIEIFGAADIGLSDFKATATGSRPVTHAVPVWNAVLGFGISQFGRRAGEVGVDQKEYDAVKRDLTERQTMIAGLEKDLEFNTVRGRVIDAETKKPMGDVKITMPESSEFKASETNDDGRFVRYFKSLVGGRLLFSKDGYESSSKFLALRPGERVTVDIELRKASAQNLADFVATIVDDQGKGIQARVTLRNIETGELTVGNSDPQGQLGLKVAEGRYLVEIRAEGFKTMGDQVEFGRGKTVLRTFTLTPS